MTSKKISEIRRKAGAKGGRAKVPKGFYFRRELAREWGEKNGQANLGIKRKRKRDRKNVP